MKLFVFVYHFILSSLLPAIVMAFFFDGMLRIAAVVTWIVLWCVTYAYLDKVILFFIGAREIIDQDSQTLFQQLKSETYRRFETEPRVYLYDGNALKCFVFESRGQWSIALDRALLGSMDQSQVKALVSYLVKYKKAGISWRLTKSYGLSALSLSLNSFFWSRLLMFKPESKPYKVLSFFTLVLLKPYIEAVLLTGRSSLTLDCDQALEPLKNISSELEPGLSFNEYLLANLLDSPNLRDLLLCRLEAFPVLEKATIKRSF